MTPRILITGATGYVGGQLLDALIAQGHPVRCLARRPEAVPVREGTGLQVIAGDVLDSAALTAALAGVTTAYYLIHSMSSTQDFEERDRLAAQMFANAARNAGVQRIIYLGGLGDAGDQLSPHLRSRHEVGGILRSTGVPVVEFRASVVIGSGSLSFEMIRSLVERLPVMIAPRWVSVAAQPIAIADLLSYLIAALDLPGKSNRIFEIGGADRVSYGGLMQEYARQRGLKRLVISVPLLTPRLSSLWLGLVTPLYARVGRKLIDSICHATIVEDPSALAEFKIRPCGYREAIRAALSADERYLMVDSRRVHVNISPGQAFAPIRRIGGKRGWYYANWLWQLRGLLDRVFGGVGLRRGRRDAESLRVGDTVDFWRVEAFELNHRLRLAAEMKLPGRAWLEFEVTRDPTGTVIQQTATFDPKGLLGRAYWYAVSPLHHFIFGGMLQGIARQGLLER
ncbi:MAG: SDR family oxidoreductase [Acidobacteria bacterium]|nr:SDR family oxidoreductase [Acidobacteriota bacterium]